MWKLAEIKSDSEYRVALCQNDSRRYLKLIEEGVNNDIKDICFFTELVPIELIKKRDIEEISKYIKLTDGSSFTIDAHGIWLTLAEADALRRQVPYDKIPWHEGKKPHFAPK